MKVLYLEDKKQKKSPFGKGKTPFPNLTVTDFGKCQDVLVDHLVKYYGHSPKSALTKINTVVSNLSCETYNRKFFRVFNGINTQGIRTKKWFTLTVFDAMEFDLFIWNTFRRADYDNSIMKTAVHMAPQFFHPSTRA